MIKQNEILLEFDKLITSLAGNGFGFTTFTSMVENRLDYNCKNIIILPDNIDDIALSFIQGFYKNVIKKMGSAEKAYDVVSFRSPNSELLRKIEKGLGLNY